jgi:hypothetical protein
MIYLISLTAILIGIAFTFRPKAVTHIMLRSARVSESYRRHFAWSLRLQGPLWVLFGAWILIGLFAD